MKLLAGFAGVTMFSALSFAAPYECAFHVVGGHVETVINVDHNDNQKIDTIDGHDIYIHTDDTGGRGTGAYSHFYALTEGDYSQGGAVIGGGYGAAQGGGTLVTYGTKKLSLICSEP